MPLSPWTDAQIIDQLDSGYRRPNATITYSFPATSVPLYGAGREGTGFSALNAEAQARAELALQLWDDLIVRDMAKVEPGLNHRSADIEYGMTTVGIPYAGTYRSAGTIWLNANAAAGGNALVTPVVGRYGFLAYVHETGHALGLDHMGLYNGAQSLGPSCFQDSFLYTVMSYYGPAVGNDGGLVAWADWTAGDGIRYSPQTPMLNDVLAVQAMYGAETTTRAGDTVYGFNSTVTDAAKAVFDFTINAHPVLCIFDSGGSDTLDLSGFTTASRIDLAPGAFSDCDSMTSNISIAYSAAIENAKGGSAADAISGNALANLLDGGGGDDRLSGLGGDDGLTGGSGDDVIDGGPGSDTVFFTAGWSALTVSFNAAARSLSFTSAADGTDTVTNAEGFVDGAGVRKTIADLVPCFSIRPSALSMNEGTGVSTSYSFTISLSMTSAQAQSVNWAVTPAGGSGQASTNDFSGAIAGTAHIAAGALSTTITLRTAPDWNFELNEEFTITLSNPTAGALIFSAAAKGVILNDDMTLIERDATIGGSDDPALLVGGRGRDDLSGFGGSDQITGLGGADTLSGFGGNDVLNGGEGRDILSGGTGADTFQYGSWEDATKGSDPRQSSDTIIDFESGIDIIDLSALDASTAAAGNNDFTWQGAGVISASADGEVGVQTIDKPGIDDDVTLVLVDMDSDIRPEFMLRCQGLIAFTKADFLL